MNLGKLVVSTFLSVALVLPLGAGAVTDVAKRQEDLDFLYAELKENHPDLFANRTEADFLSEKQVLETRLGMGSDLAFALDLERLAALAGDSHTSVSVGGAGYTLFPVSMEVYDGKWVLTLVPKTGEKWLNSEITAVNGLTMDALVDKFRPIVSYDNEVKLLRQIKQMWYVQEVLEYLDVVEDGTLTLSLKTAKGEVGTLTLNALTNEEEDVAEFARLKDTRKAVPATEPNREKVYFSLPLDEKTYYVQYNQCRQDEALPMKEFAAQVEKDLDEGRYSQVILDLRSNGGGSDGVIAPLFGVLAPLVWSGDVTLFGLIGESTFSSAGINASMIQEMGGILVGEPTGGSVDHFGSVRSFTLPNSELRVGYSTKFIDMETILITSAGQGVEPLTPDVVMGQTLEDYLAGKDTAVEYILEHGVGISLPVRDNAEATRAGYVAQVAAQARAAGLEITASKGHGFKDVIVDFAYYIPALNWAAEQGLVQGDGGGFFFPTKPITEAEKELIRQRLMALEK